MTKEQELLSRRNREKAMKYFESIYPWFKNRKPWEYCMHHENEELRHEDIERYIQWNIEDLTIKKFSEHSTHHNLERERKPLSEVQKQKISNSIKGKHYNCGSDNPMYGKPTARSKRVDVYYKGEYIESFPSKRQAAAAYSLSGINITGKEITSHHSKLQGYMFVYAND